MNILNIPEVILDIYQFSENVVRNKLGRIFHHLYVFGNKGGTNLDGSLNPIVKYYPEISEPIAIGKMLRCGVIPSIVLLIVYFWFHFGT